MVQLVGRCATPAQVANAIDFLIGGDSSWIIGQNITVDGGVVAALITGQAPLA